MLKTPIPFIDLRGKTPLDLLRAYPDKAATLIRGARNSRGRLGYVFSGLGMPFADRLSHAWLRRNQNPYLWEIESIADILGTGATALNVSYEWGCTSGVWRMGEGVTMLRVLDWVFPDLGRHCVVALQSGKAGDFYNITWPGVTAVFTAMAPNRFSAAINMAPMRRHGSAKLIDWLKNRRVTQRQTGLPPGHLLRQVCETAPDYDAAKDMLTKTPIAVPVIYILAGTKPGQGCIIERLENSAEIRPLSADQSVTTSNHFNSAYAHIGKGWRPREIDSAGRFRQSCNLAAHDVEKPDFAWLKPPILNANTRLCVSASASPAHLLVQGYEGVLPVTELFTLPVSNDMKEAV